MYILCEPNGRLSLASISSSTYYDIGEIEFRINNKFPTMKQVFLIIRPDNSKLYEVIELTKTDNATREYTIYKISSNNELRLRDDKCKIQIVVLNYEDGTYQSSNSATICLSTKNYKFVRLSRISAEINSVVSQYYERIVELTKQNLELYNSMQERGK